MKRMISILLLWSACSAALAQAAETSTGEAACDPSHHPPDRFHVAIDRASGIAFVESPCGWTWIGVVARESIDADIRMSGARPVPAEVLRAELLRQPSLARYLPGQVAPMAAGRKGRRAAAPTH